MKTAAKGYMVQCPLCQMSFGYTEGAGIVEHCGQRWFVMEGAGKPFIHALESRVEIENREQKEEAARQLFGCAIVSIHGRSLTALYSSRDDRPDISLKTLLKVCEILSCRPEELYWNADIESGYYPGDGVDIEFRFEVRK
jgi:DNA-binding Xre family transcriptional regulator